MKSSAHEMDAARGAHLCRLLTHVLSDLGAKYRRGQYEHGGNLWEKPGLLDQAIEEALDLVIYLYTLREQQAGSSGACGARPVGSRGKSWHIPRRTSAVRAARR